MYRPEGWERQLLLLLDEIKKGEPVTNADIAFADAVADAMLEALKKEGEHLGNIGTMPSESIEGRIKKADYKGRLVFIPE